MAQRSVFAHTLFNISKPNSTDKPPITEEKDDPLLGFFPELDVIPIIEAVLIIPVNFWVLHAVYKKRSLRTVANYILSSLALSDFLTGLIAIPVYLACSAIQELAICTASEMFLRFTSVSTVAHLFCVTMDRFIFIMFALRYYTIVTKQRAFIIIALMWGVSLFTSLIQLAWFGVDENVHEDATNEVKKHELRFDLFSLVVFFAIPLLVMAFVYSCIFIEIRRQNIITQKRSIPGWQEEKTNRAKERQAIITFAIMVLCYVIAWLPYFTYRIQHNFDIIPNLPIPVLYLFVYLRYATSFANPLLYIFGKQDFRKTLPKLHRKRTSATTMSRTEIFRLSEAHPLAS